MNQRRLPVGAEVQDGGVHFRVWAPGHGRVTVVVEFPHARDPIELQAEANGYFGALVPGLRAGARYRFRLGEGETLYPDLASRFQPEGPHGPSEVVDPGAYQWNDAGWSGVGIEGQVIYEIHVGTFTREGTWAAAARQLGELHRAGMTVVELMPVADFPGQFGWGYDGVDLFAPTRLYGQPDDLRRFVDEAHRLGLAVILDVVYNHVGPDGAFFRAYSRDYYSDRYENAWGDALNFDGPNSGPVREFFLANAAYWIDEYHMDGLRLDATQAIHDQSPEHLLTAISREARRAAGTRSVLLVAENESQSALLARSTDKGGCGIDALWNDDFHHEALVAATGQADAYYTDYSGTPQELISTLKHGYLYQGQWFAWQKKGRGSAAWDLAPAAFVVYLENHDQVANSGRGQRLWQITSPGRYRALTALALLAPGTPLLFQGQEFAASAPFLFFADHRGALSEAVCKGRAQFLGQFARMATAAMQARLPDPSSRETFERCRLDFAERDLHADAYAMHKDLLRLRREDLAFRAQRPGGVDGAVLSCQAFVVRYFQGENHEDDRILLVNLGRDTVLPILPEPLLAPPTGMRWAVAWSSDDPRYGGPGISDVFSDGGGMRVPAESAQVLAGRMG